MQDSIGAPPFSHNPTGASKTSVLGPVFSDALDSGVQHDDFAQSFSHTVLVTVTANHIHRVTMFVDVEAGGGKPEPTPRH